MDAKVVVKIEHAELLHQQTTLCEIELQNDGRNPLRNVNPNNHAAGPTILLTDPASRETIRFAGAKNPGIPPRQIDLPPGETLDFEFSLTSFVKFPGPGKYELIARFNWDGGEAASQPTKISIEPSSPRMSHLVTADGAISPVYLIAFINEADAKGEQGDLWLAQVTSIKRPVVSQCVHLQDKVSFSATPILSVPDFGGPIAQWLAWIDRQELRYLVHQSEEVSKAYSTKLGSADLRIVPPLFQNHPKRGEKIPPADVLLYHRAEDEDEGEFSAKRIAGGKSEDLWEDFTVPGSDPLWMNSLSSSKGTRSTFLATHDGREVAMHRFIWYAKGKPRDQPKQLASFPGEWVGGAVCRTEDDIIHGVVLTQTGASKNFEYKWHRWTLTPPDKFEQSDPIKINCDGHYTMDRAVVSLRVPTGGPYAVMRSTAQGNPWIFVSPDGATKPMPPELREGPAPSRVLFRRNSDPTILYVLPERGFHFAKP